MHPLRRLTSPPAVFNLDTDFRSDCGSLGCPNPFAMVIDHFYVMFRAICLFGLVAGLLRSLCSALAFCDFPLSVFLFLVELY